MHTASQNFLRLVSLQGVTHRPKWTESPNYESSASDLGNTTPHYVGDLQTTAAVLLWLRPSGLLPLGVRQDEKADRTEGNKLHSYPHRSRQVAMLLIVASLVLACQVHSQSFSVTSEEVRSSLTDVCLYHYKNGDPCLNTDYSILTEQGYFIDKQKIAPEKLEIELIAENVDDVGDFRLQVHDYFKIFLCCNNATCRRKCHATASSLQ